VSGFIKPSHQIKKWDYRVKENQEAPLQVFLLSGGEETNFYKSSSGGMYQSKKYFWDIAKDFKSAKELASALNNKRWEDF
jgi:hypothetical protein